MKRACLGTYVPVLISMVMIICCSMVHGTAVNPETGYQYPCEKNLLEISFVYDSHVRLRGGELQEFTNVDLSEMQGILQELSHSQWERICDLPEEDLDFLQANGEADSGRKINNLNNVYRLRFTSEADIWVLAGRLEKLPYIQRAMPVPKPMALPTPSYQTNQGYLYSAASTPTGIDANYAWTQTGGTGSGVTVCDLEYSWNYSHLDVTPLAGSQINTNCAVPVTVPPTTNDHGTAVAGELVGLNNGWGVTGICYGASLSTCCTYYGSSPSWNVAGAITVATAALSAGDVILLEQQWDYNGSAGYVPIEFWGGSQPNAVYTAIATAVSNGIHVVEAAGNGYYNLDNLTWSADSGAIIVGAGGAYTGGTWTNGDLQKLAFSSYGTRVNLQGWGENVYTTGYGDLYSIGGSNYYFTNTFSGTSSASPIVAGAVACSVGYWTNGLGQSAASLTPGTLRSVLISTGTAQITPPAGNIGPRPNLQAAFAQLAILATSTPTPTPISTNTPVPVIPNAEFGDAPDESYTGAGTWDAYPGIGGFQGARFPTCYNTVGAMMPYGAHHTNPMQGYLSFAGMVPTTELDINDPGDPDTVPNLDLFTFTPDQDDNGMPGPPDDGTQFTYGAAASITVFPMDISGGPVYINYLVDLNQDGDWNDPTEHVIQDFPAAANVPVNIPLLPPGYGMITGECWVRVTATLNPITSYGILYPWDGSVLTAFSYGETEDYILEIPPEAEYGDAPDESYSGLNVWDAYPAVSGMQAAHFPSCYNTLYGMSPNGVNHIDTSMAYLSFAGSIPTWELDVNDPADPDTVPNLDIMAFIADQDDNGLPGPPDDGVQFTMGGNASITVLANEPGGNPCFINYLVDLNQDGDWNDPGEHIIQDFPAMPNAPMVIPIPAPGYSPAVGDVWVRVTSTLAPLGGMVPFPWDGSITGSLTEGETEDYLIIVPEPAEFGDAPDESYIGISVWDAYTTIGGMQAAHFPVSYTTLFGANTYGAHHLDVTVAYLSFGGLMPSVEQDINDVMDPDGIPNLDLVGMVPDQDGSNMPGPPDDGVIFNYGAAPSIDVFVIEPGGNPCYINYLVDLNQDGDWSDSGEHILQDVVVMSNAPFNIPLPPAGYGSTAGECWVRVTATLNALATYVTLPWDGSVIAPFITGETEDYILDIIPPPTETPTPTLTPTITPTLTPTSTPTDTPVPPTDTPIPPTDTPVPPTDTPVPPTDTPVPPTDTPIPPTDTPVPPTDTPVPPTNTPTSTPTSTPVCLNHGDCTLNGAITAGDAQMAFQIALEIITPTFEEACAADCNASGGVTAGDAQAIFNAALELGTCADPIPDKASGGENPGLISRADTLWVSDASGCLTDTVVVEISMANDDTEVDVFQFDLAYDTSMLDFVEASCSEGTLVPAGGWLMFDCYEEFVGNVRFGAFTVGSPIPTGSSGTIASLSFEVVCTTCSENDTSVLDLHYLQDDIVLFSPSDGTFTYTCSGATPTPPPIPATGPVGLGILAVVLGMLMMIPVLRSRF